MKTSTTIIDGWLEPALAEEAIACWPTASANWFRYDTTQQKKATLRDLAAMPPALQKLLSHLAAEFRRRSVPDLTLWGAGLCEMVAGDFLKEHLDHAVHPHLGMKRTHNAILFLGGDGDLVVGRGSCETRVTPTPGRVCVFETTDDAWHRVEAVSELRRSLSVYFYDPEKWLNPEFCGRTRAHFAG